MIGSALIPVVGVVGFRRAGKTTLLARLIPVLRAWGLRVGVVKQARHTLDLDHPGKDSFELRKAGAAETLVASPHRWALVVETPAAAEEPRLGALVRHLDQRALDLILVEGFAHESFPKIEVHRPALHRPLLFPDDGCIIALATDQRPPCSVPVPVLDLNAPGSNRRVRVR